MEKKLLKLVSVSILFTSGLLHGQFIATNGGGVLTSNLTALTGPDDIDDFYDWSGASGDPQWSFTGALTLDLFSINSFLYKEDPSGPLSFVTIYGSDPSGASHTITSDVTLEDNTTADFSVRDDPNDPPTGPDTYLSSSIPDGLYFTTSHTWSEVRTDGYALTDISGFSKLIQSVSPDNAPWTWNLLSGDGSSFALNLNSDLVLTPVPEPATIGLMVLAGLPLALFIRRRFVKK